MLHDRLSTILRTISEGYQVFGASRSPPSAPPLSGSFDPDIVPGTYGMRREDDSTAYRSSIEWGRVVELSPTLSFVAVSMLAAVVLSACLLFYAMWHRYRRSKVDTSLKKDGQVTAPLSPGQPRKKSFSSYASTHPIFNLGPKREDASSSVRNCEKPSVSESNRASGWHQADYIHMPARFSDLKPPTWPGLGTALNMDGNRIPDYGMPEHGFDGVAASAFLPPKRPTSEPLSVLSSPSASVPSSSTSLLPNVDSRDSQSANGAQKHASASTYAFAPPTAPSIDILPESCQHSLPTSSDQNEAKTILPLAAATSIGDAPVSISSTYLSSSSRNRRAPRMRSDRDSPLPPKEPREAAYWVSIASVEPCKARVTFKPLGVANKFEASETEDSETMSTDSSTMDVDEPETKVWGAKGKNQNNAMSEDSTDSDESETSDSSSSDSSEDLRHCGRVRDEGSGDIGDESDNLNNNSSMAYDSSSASDSSSSSEEMCDETAQIQRTPKTNAIAEARPMNASMEESSEDEEDDEDDEDDEDGGDDDDGDDENEEDEESGAEEESEDDYDSALRPSKLNAKSSIHAPVVEGYTVNIIGEENEDDEKDDVDVESEEADEKEEEEEQTNVPLPSRLIGHAVAQKAIEINAIPNSRACFEVDIEASPLGELNDEDYARALQAQFDQEGEYSKPNQTGPRTSPAMATDDQERQKSVWCALNHSRPLGTASAQSTRANATIHALNDRNVSLEVDDRHIAPQAMRSARIAENQNSSQEAMRRAGAQSCATLRPHDVVIWIDGENDEEDST